MFIRKFHPKYHKLKGGDGSPSDPYSYTYTREDKDKYNLFIGDIVRIVGNPHTFEVLNENADKRAEVIEFVNTDFWVFENHVWKRNK